jgi:hypothetical protein
MGSQIIHPEPLPEVTKAQRVTVERAVTAFLAELQETAAFATHKKYRLLLTKMKDFSAERGYVMADQWEPTDVCEFRTSWAINPRTGVRRMAIVPLGNFNHSGIIRFAGVPEGDWLSRC